MKSPPPTTSWQDKPAAVAVVLFALALLAYLPALGGGFIWDDDDYVTNNSNLTTPAGLVATWTDPAASPQYYPMALMTFWVEHQLWGNHPFGYHLDNVLLHALSCVLLWRLLRRLEVPAALVAACLFAVHPLMVESVAWVTERKNVLSGVFYFASALCYVAWASRPSGPAEGQEDEGPLRGERSGGTPKPGSGAGVGLYLAALALFVLALLSKTVTCSLPAALLLILWWKRGRLTLDDLIPLLPLLAIGFALAWNTARIEITHVRAVGPEWDYTSVERLLIAGRAVWFYATKILLPVNLSFVYPMWSLRPAAAWMWAFPLGVVAALVVLWRLRSRWGRGPLVAALIYIGTLVPGLGFFNIYPMRYTLVADHYAYHAAAALFVLIAVGVRRLFRRLSEPAAAAIVVAPLLLLTMLRAGVFRDSVSLWSDTVEKNPKSWMVHLNLARALIAAGRPAEAWPQFEAQVRLAPQLPETHWNYGSSLYQRGRYDEAIAEYTEAIRLGGDDPLPQVYYRRGIAYLAVNQPAKAAADFQRTLDLRPDDAEARAELAAALAQLQQQQPAAPPAQPAPPAKPVPSPPP